ncbi:MAG: hypothetical protein ABI446_05935 [Gemmatimonadaceae bacterium]
MVVRRSLSIATMLVVAIGAFSQRVAAQETDEATPSRNADTSRAYSEPTSVYNAHRVTRVIDEGTHVVLADGTIWEVYLPDRPAVNTWRPGDLLIVRESSVTQGDYDYTLKDGRTRGAVYARLVGEGRGRS